LLEGALRVGCLSVLPVSLQLLAPIRNPCVTRQSPADGTRAEATSLRIKDSGFGIGEERDEIRQVAAEEADRPRALDREALDRLKDTSLLCEGEVRERRGKRPLTGGRVDLGRELVQDRRRRRRERQRPRQKTIEGTRQHRSGPCLDPAGRLRPRSL